MRKQLIAISAFLSSFSVMADDAQQLKQTLLAMDDFKASFSQQVHDENNQLVTEGVGEVAFDFPSKLYWHALEPDESTLVVDGVNVYLFNPFIEQVSIFDMQQAIAASPITLLVQPEQGNWQDYSVSKDNQCYQISPKANDNTNVKAVDVCFANNSIASFSLLDTQGNISQFQLQEQQGLTKADAALFRFEVTEFMDVDDQRPQGD